MNARLFQSALAVGAVLVASSYLLPSLLPGEDGPPARAARAPRRQIAQAAQPSPLELRRTDVDRTPVGAIAGASRKSPQRPDFSARVVVKAEQTVAISAEINARITRMPFKEGDRFQAGAALVEFDCQRTRAELAAATATQKLTRNAFDTTRQLQKLGSAGVYNLRQAQFEMEKANAEVENLKAKQATCVIKAPFAGVIAERLAATHEVVSPNQPLLRIVDTVAPELQLIAPSAWLDWLKPGLAFDVELDENRRKYPAKIHNVSGAVDPVSQTVRVLARFEGKPADVAPGMSGAARFPRPGGAP